ncbi:MAG TPA: HPF/RaiA family ribosome-associated protein [Chloroflexia bacterium]|nr:HPF/RaiA family ribosome-associated protein [Chloroflexia bacterium]
MTVTSFPVQITWRDMEAAEAVEKYIHKKATKLNTFYSHIIACQVFVAPYDQHRLEGKLYHVRIDLEVPGEVLMVNRGPELHSSHKDLYVAIRDAFEEIQRQLQVYADRQHHEVKFHPTQAKGVVSKLFPQEGYGFIKVPDGREIYFHAHSLLDVAFDKLEIGTELSFVETSGENGPQASTVRLAE